MYNNMPSRDDMSWLDVHRLWEQSGDNRVGVKKGIANGYILSWEFDNNEDHAHIYPKHGVWTYSIKCDNDRAFGGDKSKRTEFTIDIDITMNELFAEIIENWRIKCPQHFEGYEDIYFAPHAFADAVEPNGAEERGGKKRKSRKNKRTKKRTKKRKTRKY
jgi:hypothetical protein